MTRILLAWLFYLAGDLIWRVFDQWTRIGMRWPIYQAYHHCMMWSDGIQGGGGGPWERVDA